MVVLVPTKEASERVGEAHELRTAASFLLPLPTSSPSKPSRAITELASADGQTAYAEDELDILPAPVRLITKPSDTLRAMQRKTGSFSRYPSWDRFLATAQPKPKYVGGLRRADKLAPVRIGQSGAKDAELTSCQTIHRSAPIP